MILKVLLNAILQAFYMLIQNCDLFTNTCMHTERKREGGESETEFNPVSDWWTIPNQLRHSK